MKRESTIEIEEIVLVGNPGPTAIESAVRHALRQQRIDRTFLRSSAEAVVQDVSIGVTHALKREGV